MSGDLGYSEDDLAADLKTWWDDQVCAAAGDPFADPPAPKAGTIFEVLPEMDSLAAVTSILVIEEHLKIKIPVNIIKPGGYHSFEEMVSHILPKIRALAARRHNREAA